MPIVKKIYQNFIKQYGPKTGRERYFAWEAANPSQYRKGLATAKRHGDKILKHAPKSKRKSVKQKTKSVKDIRSYKKKVDNKMHAFGDTDFNKKVVRINKSKKKNARGDILDTIVHEKQHILHPHMKEENVRKRAARNIQHMSKTMKQQHYNMFSGRR